MSANFVRTISKLIQNADFPIFCSRIENLYSPETGSEKNLTIFT